MIASEGEGERESDACVRGSAYPRSGEVAGVEQERGNGR